jgi:hypothetical protein
MPKIRACRNIPASPFLRLSKGPTENWNSMAGINYSGLEVRKRLAS